MLSRTACGRPGTLSVWETWKPRPGGCPKLRTVGTSMYLYMHDTYWYVLAGVRVYDVGGALAMASAVQGATIRQRRPRHAARASVHLPRHRLRLPSNSCWSSSRSGSRALGRRHTTKPSRTGHAEYASRRSLRSVGMVIVGAKACDAPRQQQRQRDRSSGRDDVSGCSRPCLIAYYDLAFLGIIAY